MEVAWKNRLQEYCMKHKLSLPNYRVKNQCGPPHTPRFQVEVELNGQWYTGDNTCSSKKQAEQSAALKAWNAIVMQDTNSVSEQLSTTHLTPDYAEPSPPTYAEVMQSNETGHLPSEFVDIEKAMCTLIESLGGRVRKICPNPSGRYKFEVTGSYRYCDKIKRHHRKNQIYLLVNPKNKTYCQMCHDPDCFRFRSETKNIVIGENISMMQCEKCGKEMDVKYRQECERCEGLFCRRCVNERDLCHDAIHCDRCIDLCFDCHDS